MMMGVQLMPQQQRQTCNKQINMKPPTITYAQKTHAMMGARRGRRCTNSVIETVVAECAQVGGMCRSAC